MEKMEIENEAQDLKAAEARSTCEARDASGTTYRAPDG
jgi:hypothetical protein